MENTNPIKITDDGAYPVFTLPAKISDENIFICIISKLDSDGWKLNMDHSATLKGKSLNVPQNADINDLDLGKSKNISTNRFALSSIISKIRNGGTPNLPKVNYKIIIKTPSGSYKEEFEVSDNLNPSVLYTKITFKIEDEKADNNTNNIAGK